VFGRQKGYIKNFQIYQAKEEQVSKEFKNFGLRESRAPTVQKRVE